MLRLLFITQNDPLYIPAFFETFFGQLAGGNVAADVQGVVGQQAFNTSLAETARRLWGFYGPLDFARLGAWWATREVRDRLWQRTGLGRPIGVASLAQHYGIAFTATADLRSDGLLAYVRACAPDLLVSVSAAQRFPPALLSVPRLGAVNIHNGALPAYRGMMPNFWQLLNGEAAATTTLHTMGERLDTGSIIEEVATPIRPGMSLDELVRLTKCRSAEALTATVNRVAAGAPLAGKPIAPAEGAYYGFPDAAAARRLRRQGHPLL